MSSSLYIKKYYDLNPGVSRRSYNHILSTAILYIVICIFQIFSRMCAIITASHDAELVKGIKCVSQSKYYRLMLDFELDKMI